MPEADDPPPYLGRVIVNLLFLVVAGVAATLWVLLYTDDFEVIGGALGLGGLFVWLAFLSNLINDERKTQLQKLFDDWVLQKLVTPFVVVGLLALFAWNWPFTSGTIVFDGSQDGLHRKVQIYRLNDDGVAGNSPSYSAALTPHGVRRFPVRTPLFGECRYRLDVSGLPTKTTAVGFLSKKKIFVPNSFYQRPVLLIRPTAATSAALAQSPAILEVSRSKRNIARYEEYKGQAVWLAAGGDLPIPAHVSERWRLSLQLQRKPEAAIGLWIPALSLAKAKSFQPGDEIEIRVKLKGATEPLFVKTAVVLAIGGPQSFPQEIIIDAPD